MDPTNQVWHRLVIVSHKLTRLCDLVAGEMMYNRAQREAWFAHTVAWKKAWLYSEDTAQSADEITSENSLARR
ncbi:MAG: hypothetical protein NXI24_09650 [bacterium]|nr:hypothetical protein [bacterium]